jgi:Family of unknown function (DUF6152)
MRRIRHRKAGLAFTAVLLALAVSAPHAYAHHSFAAEFDATQPVRLTGKITRIEWTNPHTYFYIDVTAPDGKVTNWSIEGASPGALSRRAWNRGDLKLGDTVTVEGYRAKSGANVADGRRVTLPDGRALYGGSPGDGGPGDNGTDQGGLPAANR